MKRMENSKGSDSPKTSFQSQAISQLDEVIKTLRGFRKCLVEFGKLLAAYDPLVVEMAKRMKTLDRFSDTDPIAELVPFAIKEKESYRAQLEEIKKHRSDVHRRREDFVRLARDGGWDVVSTGTADLVGGYKVVHNERQSSIVFGKYNLRKISYPSGRNIFDALKNISKKLEADALKGWNEFIQQIVTTQEQLSVSEPVPWRKLLNSVIPNEAQQRRLGRILCYRLALLVSGKAPDGWRAVIVPPALSEQRTAWAVPRLDKPNDVVRVNRLRLKKMSAPTVDSDRGIPPPST